MMKKRIVSILCIIAMLATMLSVGIISATASDTATMSLSVVDDEGNAVTEMNPGDSAWLAFTLSDYATAMGEQSIAVIQAFADFDSDKFTIDDSNGQWSTPYENVTTGGNVTTNVADNVFGVIIETDANAGATYAISKAELDANNGLLFKIKVTAKEAASGTGVFKVKATNDTASTSIAFANATAPTLTCDETAISVEVKAAETSTVTTLVPITDASKWTGKTDKITANGTFAAVKGEGNERVITTADTYDFGNKLKVSGTLIQRTVSGSQTAKSYVKVGDFRFEIEDDLTSFYVRAVMGEEVVYEESWTRAELDSMQYKHFYKVDFNATIDNTAKTVTLDYLTGNRYAAETVKETGSGTYTGDYSFDGVNCVASFKSNWIADGSNEVVGVLGFSVEKLGGDVSSEEVSSEEVSSEEASSEEVSSEEVSSEVPSSEEVSSEEPAPEVPTEAVLIPITDTSKWTGNTQFIKADETVISGVTCTPAGSFVLRDNSNEHKEITTVDTYNLGNNFKVSGTLAGTKFRRSDDFYAYAYAQVGDFKFVIGDERDETDASRPKVMFVRAYMGEELVYEERIMQGNTLGLNIFDQVNFNATIDNNAKTVTLDYTKGAIGALETINGTGTYTGDYSFDAVTATAALKNNYVATDDAVNVAVAGLSVKQLSGDDSSEEPSSEAPSSEEPSSEAPSSEEPSSEAPSSQEPSSEAPSSDNTSSEDASSEDASSDTPSRVPTEKFTTLVPVTDVNKWTGRTDKITSTGTFASVSGEGSQRVITSVDTFDFGDKFKVSGTLIQRMLSDSFGAKSYVKAGDFKFEIEDDKTTFYVRAYMGEEVVYEKSWTRTELSDMKYKLFYKVDFNVTIDTNAKTIVLDYLTKNRFAQEVEQETGSGIYTGDYAFDNVYCEVSRTSNWITDGDLETVGVLAFSVEKIDASSESTPSDDTSSVDDSKLVYSIDQESFKEEDWTGDTAVGQYDAAGGPYYHGLVDGEFLCPANSEKITITSVKSWDLSGGFNGSIDMAFAGNWNFDFSRTMSYSVGPATVTFTSGVQPVEDKKYQPDDWYVSLSLNGVELGTAQLDMCPDGIVGITYDAENKILYATFFDTPIELTPVAGGEKVEGIDVSTFVNDDTFADAHISIYQAGCWAIERKVSTYSLSTPDSLTPEAPPAPSESTPSEEPSSEAPSSEEPSSEAPSSTPTSSAPASSTPASSAPVNSNAGNDDGNNNGGNGGATNNGGTSSKSGETVEYYYYLDNGTYGTATGDSSNVLAAIIVLLAASGAAAGLLISRKRKSNSEK